MNADEFLNKVELLFPEAFSEVSEFEKGIFHCEMGAFRRWTENQMAEGKGWNCEKMFTFIDHCLDIADSELRNAIDISFIEDLAFGQHNLKHRKVLKERASRRFQKLMASHHEFWE